MTVEEMINKLRLFDKHKQVKIELEGKYYDVYTLCDVHNVPVIEANSWSVNDTHSP